MVKFAMVQGRLSSEVACKYQYFPIHNWKQEFAKAKEIGFDGIEWIISDYSNPIFNHDMRKEILDVVNQTKIQISSISLDLLMIKTLDLFSIGELKWIFEAINKISDEVNLSRVSIPIEETCGLRDPFTKDKVVNKIQDLIKIDCFRNYLVAIESDMSPHALEVIFQNENLNNIGILLDTGNAAAYGYKLKDYFCNLGKKIYSIHIKDRLGGIGPSVPLGTGGAEFKVLKENLNTLSNLKDITLQTYKSIDNYEQDLLVAKEFVQKNILSR